MNCFEIKTGIVVIANGDSGRSIMDEAGRKRIVSPLASELIGLISEGFGDEDSLAETLQDRFSLGHIYYMLIQLEKQGVVVRDTAQPVSPADLFRTKICGPEQAGYRLSPVSVMAVRIVSIAGSDASADAFAVSLARSDALAVERVPDWHIDFGKFIAAFPGEEATLPAGGQAPAPLMEITTVDTLYVVVTPDYLEPELESFGRLAYKLGFRWLPVKPSGVVPWMGPLFMPGETGCVECLLDRVRGHRRLEVKQIRENGGKESLRLSVGQTVHSFEATAGLLAVELEKVAADGTPEIAGGVFTLDFRTLRLTKHRLIKRLQCPVCGTLSQKTVLKGTMPEEPLPLQPRVKADYRDGGERVCAAAETLDKYAYLLSPVTGVVGQFTQLEDIPSCFGAVIKSDWIVRGSGEPTGNRHNGRLSALGLSTGKGRSAIQARASALGEAVERYCSQYEGYESRIRASFMELGNMAVHPQDLMGFSERQYADREIWRRKGDAAHVPDPYDNDRPIDWTPAWSLTHKRWRLVPSAFVYYSYPPEGGGDICRGCSNGVAAGNCIEEAIMQGFYELVERDATAMWWYHRLRKSAVDWRSFDSPFAATVDVAMKEMRMSFEILDFTNDLGIPVFSAHLFNGSEDARLKAIGLGCHRDPCIAIDRAVSELGQCWRLTERNEESLKFQNSPHSKELFLRADSRQISKRPSDFAKEENRDFLDDIEDTVRLLRTHELEMLVIDLTRPDVGFPVARVIVPGMTHFWPRFGCHRLFVVPKRAGWIDNSTGEDDLNPIPFFL